jgi:hypothetical protein
VKPDARNLITASLAGSIAFSIFSVNAEIIERVRFLPAARAAHGTQHVDQKRETCKKMKYHLRKSALLKRV